MGLERKADEERLGFLALFILGRILRGDLEMLHEEKSRR